MDNKRVLADQLHLVYEENCVHSIFHQTINYFCCQFLSDLPVVMLTAPLIMVHFNLRFHGNDFKMLQSIMIILKKSQKFTE